MSGQRGGKMIVADMRDMFNQAERRCPGEEEEKDDGNVRGE